MEQDFLLEIGTEEIPARFIPGALESLKALAEGRFSQSRLVFREVKTLGTPRRLALLVFGLEPQQENKDEVIIGPPQSAAFSPDGTPTKVALGFARAKGVAVEDLELMETTKGLYLGLKKRIQGLPTIQVLSELLPSLILDIPFPKSMRWGAVTIRFARPIHWIVALYGHRVVPFSLGGIESGPETRGHRFMAPQGLSIREIREYPSQLRQAFVLVDPEERREVLKNQIESLARQDGGRLLEDPDLLHEVTHLVEYPQAVAGKFDSQFLKLPPEVLITSMREHQRYFSIVDSSGGLQARFIAVNNTPVKEAGQVTRGHEKVLRARLYDAQFFFQEDTREPLEQKVERLKGVVFHSQLGTSYEKVERITALAGSLSRKLAPEQEAWVKRTAWLAKADLTTQMVGEFPTLQGVMGREYALLSGEPEEVAQGIYEHYLPTSATSPVPKSLTGSLVGLADRLDTLVGFIGLGEIPTGSADPYALRRAAQGLVLILWEKGYSFPFSDLVKESLSLFPGRFKEPPALIVKKVFDFMTLRLEYLLEGEGIGREGIDAVLSAGWEDITEVRIRARALDRFQKHPDFASLAIGCKRAINILKGVDPSRLPGVDPNLLLEPAERRLYEKIEEVGIELDRYLRDRDYQAYLTQLARLKTSIDTFFDQVLVMDREEKIKENRLSLLFKLVNLFEKFARFSKFSI